MRSLTYLPHTADIRIRLVADSFEELLRAGVEAIHQILAPKACSQHFTPELSEDLEVRSSDYTTLLVDFLSEVLTASHTYGALFCDSSMEKTDGYVIKATLLGKRVDHFVEDIKAVTYHEANVIQDAQGKWTTMLVLDI